MGYVTIDRDASTRAAQDFGKEATGVVALDILSKARGLAPARAKRSSVAGRIKLEPGGRPQDTRIVMSVEELRENGHGVMELVDVAPHLEWGYTDSRSGKHVPGKHILRDATFGG
jgi:hypothetical protein